jgi:hypothetical protein
VVEYFVGRDAELHALEHALGQDHQAVITQTLAGLGGVGKTQLAAAYVRIHADEYDLVAWIRAEDGGTADLAELAVQLGMPAEGLPPVDQAVRAVRFLEGTEQNWLLILDNVAGPDQLEGCCPASGTGRVLVTSRHQGFEDFGPVLPVGVLDAQHAENYLVERAHRPTERAGARTLARALGCLPLALSHAGSYCAEGTSFEEYLGLLEGLPAAELFATDTQAFYERTVASTWEPSMQAAESAAPLARPVLAMAAYFAPDAIPRSLFATLTDANNPANRKALTDALRALHRFSLVEVMDARLTVHRLVQKVVRDAVESNDDYSGAQAALAAVGKVFPFDVELPATWPACEQLVPHALALASRWRPSWREAKTLVQILNRATDYLYYGSGGGERAIAGAIVALELAERILGAEHPDTLMARENLASAYHSAGRTAEAIPIKEQVVADRERILGAEHPDTLRARGNLAVSYRSAGRTAEAIAIEEQVVADRERILGAEHPDTLRARANLAWSYRSAEASRQR